MEGQQIESDAQSQEFIRLVDPSDNPPFDRDDVSGLIEFPQRSTNLGTAQLMLHQMYKDESVEYGGYKLRSGFDENEPVLAITKNGVNRMTFQSAQENKGLFALNIAVINKEGETMDAYMTVSHGDSTYSEIKGRMHRSKYVKDQTLFNEPSTWIAYFKNENGNEEPIATELVFVPRDSEFLSTLGFKFNKVTRGGDN